MSDTPCLDSTDNILGQEFLTWLWYQSDVAPGAFVDKEGQPFSVSMEQRIVVQGGEGDAKETATVAGTLSPLREARFGLGTGKKVTRALIRLEKEELAFQFTLKAEDFTLGSLKTPKVEKPEEDDDPDAMLLEKIYLMEVCLGLLDSLYARFLQLRLSPQWQQEDPDGIITEDMRAGGLFIPQCGPAAADVAHRAQTAVDAAGLMGDHPHQLLGHPSRARFAHRYGNDPQSSGR